MTDSLTEGLGASASGGRGHFRHADDYTVEMGPKPLAAGSRAVCSTGNEIVTETVISILKEGGSAVDAGIAASLVQAVVEPHLTNHGGSVSALYWDAETGEYHQLNAIGAFVPNKPLFKPVPQGVGGYCPAGWPAVSACIPGFMPGLQALYERFGNLSWQRLCEPAVEWAEKGHRISSFEYGVNVEYMPFITYFPEGREYFTPDGFLPPVGTIFRNAGLAETMRRLSDEGPDHFISGEWARAFVGTANQLGWDITLDHMTIAEPRWGDPIRYQHGANEIIQLAPPERQGFFCALVLGIMRSVRDELGPLSEADHIYFMAHALRWADKEMGYLHDPHIFAVPEDVWLDHQYHEYIARILVGSRPKVDLSDHVLNVGGRAGLAAAGASLGVASVKRQPLGSCELSVVDEQGNWLQMMHTLQTGGIPGAVVDGVPMVGSHAVMPGMDYAISGWLADGARPRCVIGNTIVAKNNMPVLSLGTPGNAHCTVPQVLHNILDLGMEPYEAVDAPRMLPLDGRFRLSMEARVSADVVGALASSGILIGALPGYDWRMGSFQVCWRDEETGRLGACADPRRCGVAAGY